MSTLTTVTIASGSGDTVTTALTSLWANQQIIDKTHADTSDPAAPADGTQWIRTDGANNGVLYAMINSVKTEVLFQPTLNVDLDLNGNELKNAVHEKLATGSLPAAGAATEGETPWDSTVERLAIISSTDQHYALQANLDGTVMLPIPCSLNVANVGQAATADTNTRKAGWLLNAVADELNWVAEHEIPDGYTAAHDCYLDVHFMLSAAETASDTTDIDNTWISETPGSGDDVAKTATASTTINYDIGAANGQYDAHTLRITLDYDDANNPIAVGDLVSGYLNLNSIASVAAIIVTAVTLLVPIYNAEWN